MRAFAALLLSCLLASCATMQPNFEDPQIELISIALLPSEGMQINFDLGLKVTNPNNMALNVVGLAYDLSLDGFEVVKGVGNDLPPIPAYGSENIKVQASTNLMQSFKLLSELMSRPRSSMNYSLNTKLDLGSTWLPALRLTDEGEIDLENLSKE